MDLFVNRLHSKFQSTRLSLFLKYFGGKKGRLLDLGGGDGSFLWKFHDKLLNYDIYVADINRNALERAKKRTGFKTIKLNENSKLPFIYHEWDVIFCNSVIEHCTGPKQRVITMRKTSEFKNVASRYQKAFAKEISRIGKSYFVQTPHKLFPIESHTQFPFIGYLSRPFSWILIKILNSFWIKKTQLDWNLLNEREMKILFPKATIHVEKFLGLPKSIIAFKL